MTASASAMAGTSRGWANDTASTRRAPAATSRPISSTLASVDRISASFWSPSRGLTSTITTSGIGPAPVVTRRGRSALGDPPAHGRLGPLFPGLVGAVLGAELLGPALVGLGVVLAELVREQGVLGQDVDPGDVVAVGHVEEAAVHHHRGPAAVGVDEHRPDGQGGQQGRVAREHAEVAVDPAGGDEVGLPGPYLALGGDQVDVEAGHG